MKVTSVGHGRYVGCSRQSHLIDCNDVVDYTLLWVGVKNDLLRITVLEECSGFPLLECVCVCVCVYVCVWLCVCVHLCASCVCVCACMYVMCTCMCIIPMITCDTVNSHMTTAI